MSVIGERDSPDESPSQPPSPQEGARPVCHLKRGIARRAERGHLWVFSNEIDKFDTTPADGDEVIVRSSRGHHLGTGLYSRSALIAIRLYSRDIQAFDGEFLRRRLVQALERRSREWAEEPGGYRVCFSEGDLVPGLIVDRYADHIVFQLLTAGMDRRRDLVVEILDDLFHPVCLYERSDVPTRTHEGVEERAGSVRGELNPELTVQLDDLLVQVDVAAGQKTGLYLDQVHNWRQGRRYAQGRHVLDCFCYQGGWSLWAGRGGAAECLGIDASQAAVDAAKANARRNALESVCRYEKADVFEKLRAFQQEGRRFDLIVLDPPAFARNRKQVKDAQRGYRELNLRALRLLSPGGILFTCSCSHHITPEMFDEILVMAARDAGRVVRVLPGPGQPFDHPVLLSTPETRYLKVRALETAEG